MTADTGVEYLFTGDITDDLFKSLAIHAKHLADLSASADPVSSRAGRSFSINIVRARCNRDRTVPIAQPKTPAASA